MPVRTPPPSRQTAASNLVSGIAGGLVVLAIGGTLIGTGVINSGDPHTRVIREVQVPSGTTVAENRSGGGLSVADIYRRRASGVVFVQARVVSQTSSPFGFPLEQEGLATGSGFVLDKAG